MALVHCYRTSTASKECQKFVRHLASGAPILPKCDFKPKKYNGPSTETLTKMHQQYLNSALKTYYRQPLALHQGYRQWLWDVDGKRYLDMFAGICTVSVGHCHPRINEAVSEQMDTLGHVSNIYYHQKIHEYAEKLAGKFPGDLKVVYFVNSGSEANDLALLMARQHTKNFDVISFRNSYHGMSMKMMGVTANSNYKYTIPQPPGIHHAMNPDPYKGIWGGAFCRDSPVQTRRSCRCDPTGPCVASGEYLKQIEEMFVYSMPKGRLAGFYAESIQGVGGSVQYPKGYLKGLQQIVKQNGGVFISDEVQTGFGRTGEHYWGYQMHGITPDIVTMAKGIGNGFPLAAVVTTPEIAGSLNAANHFNTYGGNPVACAVGSTVLDIIDEEKLQDNSRVVGTYLLQQLDKLRDDFEVIGDVRGKGLMIGMELVESKGTTTPIAAETFMNVWESCADLGVLIGRGGISGNVLRIKPPMCITKEDADFTVDALRLSLNTYAK